MLERLAGRLKWERDGSGIRVEIPARAGWLLAFFLLWLILWGGIGGTMVVRALADDDLSTFMLVWSIAWAAGVLFGLGAIIWGTSGRTMLFLNQSEMMIQRRVMGMEWDNRSFATRDVRNLRFIPASLRSGWSGSNYERTYTQSQICFEADGKTRNLASGLSDVEAFALIDRMLEIYEFPRDRALDYIGKP